MMNAYYDNRYDRYVIAAPSYDEQGETAQLIILTREDFERLNQQIEAALMKALETTDREAE